MVKVIGVFDSGIGGLTVARELLRILPEKQIIYFGDTARVPYGGKSTSTIKNFSDQIVNFLLKRDVQLIVAACNTVSSTSLEWLKNKYTLPIVGVIEPGARESVRTTRNNIIGVIGTRATIESSAYRFAIHRINPNIKVYSKSCPLLVPIIEEERSNSEVTRLVLERYLFRLKKNNIDTLILGCTHYPIIKNEIQQVMGKDVQIIDSASLVALEVKNILNRVDVHPPLPRTRITTAPQDSAKNHAFYFSDIPRGFKQLSKRFLGYPISYTRTAL